jgi:hypothetical protein
MLGTYENPHLLNRRWEKGDAENLYKRVGQTKNVKI